MTLDQITVGDVLTYTDKHGTAYYKVLAKHRVNVSVMHESGSVSRCSPHLFRRKVTYPVAAFESDSHD